MSKKEASQTEKQIVIKIEKLVDNLVILNADNLENEIKAKVEKVVLEALNEALDKVEY